MIVASMPMWSAVTRSIPVRARPAPRNRLPPPMTTASSTARPMTSRISPAMRLSTTGSMP